MRNFIILLVLLIIIPSCILFAQNTDSVWQNRQISNAARFYDEQFSGPNSSVYQGYEYLPYILPARGNAFFITNEWQEGSVFFNGKLYTHLPLLYDVLKDQLVLQSWNKIYRILLSSKNVGWFTIGTHYFIHISHDSSGKSLPEGYYEELVRGKTMLLAKRMKIVIAQNALATNKEFTETDLYYIKKMEHYYKVKTKRSVLKVLQDHKKDIRHYLKENDIQFDVNREAAMIEMVKYENLLNK